MLIILYWFACIILPTLKREEINLRSLAMQLQQQHTLCILYAYQYSQRPDNKVSNSRRMCALLLHMLRRRSITLSQMVAAHMQCC